MYRRDIELIYFDWIFMFYEKFANAENLIEKDRVIPKYEQTIVQLMPENISLIDMQCILISLENASKSFALLKLLNGCENENLYRSPDLNRVLFSRAFNYSVDMLHMKRYYLLKSLLKCIRIFNSHTSGKHSHPLYTVY